MTYALALDTAPTTYPVSLEEVKLHLRLADQSEEDALLTILIDAATAQAELFTQRRFVSQTWKLYLDSWPGDGVILLPYPPLQSVTYIKYYDTQGTLQTLSTSDYVVDSNNFPARIVPAPQLVWPSLQTDKVNGIEIKFISGYLNTTAVNALPGSIKAAILLIVAHFYEHRQEFITGTIIAKVPMASEWLLWPYRDIREL